MFYLFSLANIWKLKSGITINLAVMTGYTQAQLHFQRTSEKFSTTTRHTAIFNGEYVTLTVSVQVKCDQGYLVPNCLEMCVPRNDSGGYYECDYNNSTKNVFLTGLEWKQTAQNIAYHKIARMGITTARKRETKYVLIIGMEETVHHIAKSQLMVVILVITQTV